jgi:hypothetical protein
MLITIYTTNISKWLIIKALSIEQLKIKVKTEIKKI